MKRSQFVVLVFVTGLSGLIGGGLTTWLFRADSASATEAMLSMSEKKKSTGPKKVISAKAFHLVDDQKRVLAILGVDEGNSETGKQVGLTIFDETGAKRTRLYGAKWAAAIDLYDAQGNVRFHAGESAPGGQMSNSSIFLADTAGKPAVKCDISALGGMFAQCTDPQGRGLVVGSSPMKPKPYVKLKGGGSSVLWSAP